MENSIKTETLVKVIKNKDREELTLKLMKLGMYEDFLNSLPFSELRKMSVAFL